MPVYDFKCNNSSCGLDYEVSEELSIKEYESLCREERLCPNCDVEMDRIITKTNFILKGGGWAKDGYEKNGK